MCVLFDSNIFLLHLLHLHLVKYCMNVSTYTQSRSLCGNKPIYYHSGESVSHTLLSRYRPPSEDGRLPGRYELKAESYAEYDPCFFHLSRRDHEQAVDRVEDARRKLAQQTTTTFSASSPSSGSSSGSSPDPRPTTRYPKGLAPNHAVLEMLLSPSLAAVVVSILAGAAAALSTPPKQEAGRKKTRKDAEEKKAILAERQWTSEGLVGVAMQVISLGLQAYETMKRQCALSGRRSDRRSGPLSGPLRD